MTACWTARNLLEVVQESPTPDEFSFAILDRTGAEIPTGGLVAVGADVLLLIDLDSAESGDADVRGDGSRSPVGGDGPVGLGAPTVTPVPEPGSWGLLGLGVVAICGWAKIVSHNGRNSRARETLSDSSRA